MRYKYLVLALAVTLLSGCSSKQKANVSQTTHSVQTETHQLAHKAAQDVDEGTTTLRVKSALDASTALHGSSIHVTTEAHAVVLRGTVLTDDQKTLAEHIVRDTIGANRAIDNHLTIEKRAAKVGK